MMMADFDNRAWPEPDLGLLHDHRPPAAAFPLIAFPDPWVEWIGKVAVATNAPVDFVAMPLLTVAGNLIGNSRWIQTTRDLRSPPVLWSAQVGLPGSGKSPAQDAVLAIAETLQSEMQAGYPDAIAKYQQDAELAKLAKAAWQEDCRAALRGDKQTPPMPDAALEPDKPQMPRFLVGDITFEELNAVAAGNPRGLLKRHDELAGWFGSFNQYRQGSDRENYLERYDGKPLSVDRKTQASLYISRHAVGLVGGIQPDKLDVCLGRMDDGLAGRFCWSFPDPIPVADPEDHDPDPWAESALRRLLELPMAVDQDCKPIPVFREFATDAREAFMAGRRSIKTEARERHGYLATALDKSPGMVARLSLIFEYLDWVTTDAPEPQAVSLLGVQRAGTLYQNYLAPMAERVFGNYALPAEERLAAQMLRHIRKHKTRTFNARSIRRGEGAWHMPGLSNSEHLQAALTLLQDGCIIRPAERMPERGRPPADFDVSPKAILQ